MVCPEGRRGCVTVAPDRHWADGAGAGQVGAGIGAGAAPLRAAIYIPAPPRSVVVTVAGTT
jgi:hypothetical protein